jgi:hypothetical protein
VTGTKAGSTRTYKVDITQTGESKESGHGQARGVRLKPLKTKHQTKVVSRSMAAKSAYQTSACT